MMDMLSITNNSQPNIQTNISTKTASRLNDTAKEFESVFMAEMMKPMFEGLETDGLFGGGQAEKVFQNLMIQEFGKTMSQTGRIGIADEIKGAMIEMQSNRSINNRLANPKT